MYRNAAIIAIFAAAAILVACTGRTPLDAPPSAAFTYSEVNKLVAEAARSNGANLAEYSSPVISYDGTKSEDQWTASFTLKGEGRPGGHFTVIADDRSKRTKFLPGE